MLKEHLLRALLERQSLKDPGSAHELALGDIKRKDGRIKVRGGWTKSTIFM
jgi:hypothetical protein